MTVEEMYELTMSPFREWWKGLGISLRAMGRGDFVPIAIARVIYRSTWVSVTTRVLADRVAVGDLCRTRDGRYYSPTCQCALCAQIRYEETHE